MNFYTKYKTPFGYILIVIEDGYLTRIFLNADEGMKQLPDKCKENPKECKYITDQFDLYFEGKIKEFDLKINPSGTEFQKKAWQALLKIPYGKTVSYKDQAILMDSPNSTRAVGNANGRNPIPIVIPCHRVIKNDGSLGGFSSGIDKKSFLLDLEKRFKD